MKENNISAATEKNWKRLGTNENGRLTKRANKKKSTKRIIPYEYVSSKDNIPLLEDISEYIITKGFRITDSIFSLCVSRLKSYGIFNNPNVKKVFEEYDDMTLIPLLSNLHLPDNEFDFIGAVYQSLLSEGSKNSSGSYFTPTAVTTQMTSTLSFTDGQTFLDPCCGSGAFLLSADCDDPGLLFGADNDYIAVMIARTNLLCKYKNKSFIPNIYCTDFFSADNPINSLRFDYIVTNPPWGASDRKTSNSKKSSSESFSDFFIYSFSKLNENGIIRFLFPESVLNVKTHRELRKFMLDNCSIDSINLYSQNFTGVLTQFVDISASKREKQQFVKVTDNEITFDVSVSSFRATKNLVFNLISQYDMSIINKVKKISPYNLNDSTWALGIVTGNNAEKLYDSCEDGMEPIYTGKEISQYTLMPAQKYIVYDRAQFQQAARDEIYRAEEKLVYKFISDKPVFAYDNSKRLFLNSANILIPNIEGMSVKTVMAFLNSELYTFLYRKLFGEIKILKGNLAELPFPQISPEINSSLEMLVDEIISSNDKQLTEELQTKIYKIFKLDDEEINYIKKQILK